MNVSIASDALLHRIADTDFRGHGYIARHELHARQRSRRAQALRAQRDAEARNRRSVARLVSSL